VLISRFLKLDDENFLDEVLRLYDYDLEQAIDAYRMIVEPIITFGAVCGQCCYSPVFCMCADVASCEVSCGDCQHFIPDTVGDRVGIGSCHIGLIWTRESSGMRPLYRFAKRHCDKFIELIAN